MLGKEAKIELNSKTFKCAFGSFFKVNQMISVVSIKSRENMAMIAPDIVSKS